MYRAIKNIGDYKIGDTVPDSKAELWLEMYGVPHVEEIGSEEAEVESIEEVLSEEIVEEPSRDLTLNNMNEDYLGRNQSVVKKNIGEDNLSERQLRNLLELEGKDKKRPIIINTILQKLKDF